MAAAGDDPLWPAGRRKELGAALKTWRKERLREPNLMRLSGTTGSPSYGTLRALEAGKIPHPSARVKGMTEKTWRLKPGTLDRFAAGQISALEPSEDLLRVGPDELAALVRDRFGLSPAEMIRMGRAMTELGEWLASARDRQDLAG